MITVMVFGTFDILHAGHRYVFREAKKLGDELFVVVGRDSTVLRLKGALPVHTEALRLKVVASSDLVDTAVLGDPSDFYKVIVDIHPDIICLGYDQRGIEINQEILKKLKIKSRIVRLSSFKPETYKSSKLLPR